MQVNQDKPPEDGRSWRCPPGLPQRDDCPSPAASDQISGSMNAECRASPDRMSNPLIAHI
jgi:hypothetical protein